MAELRVEIGLAGYFFPTPAKGHSRLIAAYAELELQRVDNFEKGKPVEVRIPGADPSDSVLAHENRCVRVVKQIARQVRKLRDDLPGYLRMSLRSDEDTEPRRGE